MLIRIINRGIRHHRYGSSLFFFDILYRRICLIGWLVLLIYSIDKRGIDSMHDFIYERIHHAVVGLYGWLMTACSSLTHYYLFLLFDYVAALCTILIPQHDIFDFTTMAHHVYWCKNRKLLQPRQSYHQCQRRNKKQNKNVHNHEII